MSAAIAGLIDRARSLALAILSVLAVTVPGALAEPRHGIAMHGEPELPAEFTAFPWVNPEAPQGGAYREALTGTFDSTNPFIVRGKSAAGVRTYVFESLMARNRSEPFSLYGLLAETIDVSPDRRQVTFRLRPEARFSDGTSVTAADVRFSLEILRDHGRPNYRSYYEKVERIETPDARTVTLLLGAADRELVLVIGLMPVLPEHVFAGRDFEASTLDPLIGSGPYRFKEIKAGERVVYERNPDWWGRGLAVNRGLWNFDEVRFDYYLDGNAALEAFRRGLVDIRAEGDPARWAGDYNFPAAADGAVVLETIPSGLPRPASAFAMNTRRPVLANAGVREALILAFDFEWANTNLFHGLMQRTQGYFAGSPLSFAGHPASARERRMLADAHASLPETILDGSWRLPVSDGRGRDRANLRKAVAILAEQGYRLAGGVMRDSKSGRPLSFELLVQTREQERVALHYQRSLRSIGIELAVRQVDPAQFQRRLDVYDYDLVPVSWSNSLSPGNEQAYYWGSVGRETPGTRNYAGVADPAIDHIVAELVKCSDRETFEDAARALDRLLVAGNYAILLYAAPGQWIARWTRIGRPVRPSLYGFDPEASWANH
jgi:peptide/nickel transport system substrate-binding protein